MAVRGRQNQRLVPELKVDASLSVRVSSAMRLAISSSRSSGADVGSGDTGSSRICAAPCMIRTPIRSSMWSSRSVLGLRPAETSRACTASTSSCRDSVQGQRALSASSAALIPGSFVNSVASSGSWYSWRELSRRVSPSTGGNHAAKCIRR